MRRFHFLDHRLRLNSNSATSISSFELAKWLLSYKSSRASRKRFGSVKLIKFQGIQGIIKEFSEGLETVTRKEGFRRPR